MSLLNSRERNIKVREDPFYSYTSQYRNNLI